MWPRVQFPREPWEMIIWIAMMFPVADIMPDRPPMMREPSSSLGTNREILHLSQKRIRWEKEEIFTQ